MVGSAEMVSMSLMRGNPRVEGGRPGTAPSVPAPAPLPPSIPPSESGSAFDVQEIHDEEARGRQKPLGSVGGGGGGAAILPVKRRKGPVDTSVEPPAPRQRPKSARELCSARAGVDGRDYHAIRMCNLPEQASDAPLDPDLRSLTHGTSVWQSGGASATYI
ncbi:hypothetical protein BHE74_00010192 [Ensete ventricosum]|nr:hypothetical protein BHE74_00010192 [Ensete ventricosum]